MIAIPKFDFVPEAPASPFKTIPLSELKQALLNKRLRAYQLRTVKKKVKDPWGKRFVWARPPHHPVIRRAQQWCETEILADLQSGVLTAHTHTGGSELFYRIPREFWRAEYAGLALGGILLDLVEDRTFRREFIGSAVYIFDRCARSWLRRRKINEKNPAFPDRLRHRHLSPPSSQPPLEKVRAKMLTLMKSGLSRDEAAIRIRQIPGFEAVRNADAREAIRGFVNRGRRPKNRQGN